MKGLGNAFVFATFALIFSSLAVDQIHGQYFNPRESDKTYLDSIQNEVVEEVQETKSELVDEARIIQGMAKNFVAATLKKNLFIALRVLAEKELGIDKTKKSELINRKPRQDEEGGDDGDSESTATRRPSQILPQVANLIKAVFGGNINLTAYVEGASAFLPKPIGTQLTGVVKLLANNPGHKYTTTTTTTTTTTPNTTTVPSTPAGLKTGPPSNEAAPTQLPLGQGQGQSQGQGPALEPVQVQVPAQSQSQSQGQGQAQTVRERRTTSVPTEATTPSTTSTTEEEEEEEEYKDFPTDDLSKSKKRKSAISGNGNGSPRQLEEGLGFLQGLGQAANIGSSLLSIGSTFGNVFNTLNRNNANNNQNQQNQAQVVQTVQTQNATALASASGFDAQTSSGDASSAMSGINMNSLAKEFRMGLGDIVKVMPDLFRGAHEAFKLISSVSRLFARLDVEL